MVRTTTRSSSQFSQAAKKSSTQSSANEAFHLELALSATKVGKGSVQTDTLGEVLVVFASQVSTKKKAGKDSAASEEKQISVHHGQPIKDFLAASIEEKSLTGKFKECIFFREAKVAGFRHLIVLGLGEHPDHEKVRQAAGQLTKNIKDLKVKTVDIAISGCAAVSSEAGLKAFCEGLLLAAYSFDELKSKKPNGNEGPKTKTVRLHVSSINAKLKGALDEAKDLAYYVNFSRRLGDLPGNLMTPTLLAEAAEREAKSLGIKFQAWGPERLKKERMGGLLGVAQGSEQEPRFIIMEYHGGKKGAAPIVFVGKGLTFDTGGISIKPSAAMEEMKYDMCGGANVIGAVLAIAKLKLKVNVVGLVPSTENMPSGRATKPGDVHVARNGKSFEVNNTDAEGRLILSDALSYGSELKPKMMVDAATLTGAIVVALGNTHTGVFTRDEALANRIQKAANSSGEWVWRMPLTDYHVEDIKGTFADWNNISNFKGAGSATAAAFLEQFVDKGIPWAHFDIAGTAWATGNRLSYCSAKGASGAMVRTFVELARSYEG